jgi:hypothetical protein
MHASENPRWQKTACILLLVHWRVMLVEKTGHVEFVVMANGQTQRVYPERELTRLQFAQMSVQPDMIQQYAKHLAERYGTNGAGPVEVRADAWAQLNGRPMQRLIDPVVDLAAQPRSLLPAPWIVPLVRLHPGD